MTNKRIIQGLEKEYSRLLGSRETLVAGREQALGEASKGKQKIAELDQTLIAVQASIRLFKPSWDPSTMEPQRTNRRRSPLPHGMASAFPKTLLRTHKDGLTTIEITMEMMRVHNLPANLKMHLRQSIHHNMLSAERRGIAAFDEASRKWRLTRKNDPAAPTA